ncbi:Transcriptional regulator, ArsR family [Thermogutta terrifontis]|uniref:Transcriptional regulator, ArsR family n=1 Tax=Thermogutta terrifontis TaxID=1331910 RepID=A0A286RFL9_9BACT|nr:metalloregulator ArsR/SmtB family transcription factor [Thermogutta terrifontis]ASV74758.1 Transcriptional regulator, ArsR family [Thermogutta terrifontis]
MLPSDECQILANFFNLLSHPTRLQFFCLLREGEKTVTQLADAAGVASQNASQHLRLMRETGVVKTARRGQQIFYRLADPRLAEAIDLLRQTVLSMIEQSLPRAVQERFKMPAENSESGGVFPPASGSL